MPKKDLPNIGNKLELYNLSKSNKKQKYISQMLDAIDEYNFIISGPLSNINIVPMYIDNVVEVSYYKENKGKFFFQAIIKKVINENIYKLKIERTTEIKKIQQRDFYRLPYSLPIIKTHIIGEGDTLNEVKEESFTEDISGGGIGLLTNLKHDEGDIVKLNFEMDKFNIDIVGRVVRIDTCNHSDYKYTLGVKFVEIDDLDRERIVKFIFNQQRKLRKKGLI